jgi:hypothetical protein
MRQQYEVCDECGFDPLAIPEPGLGEAMRATGRAWHAWLIVHAQHPKLRERPAPGVWSAIELAGHVRDVLLVFADRTARTLAEDHPVLGWWDHEASAAGYADEDPVAVAAALGAAADRYGTMLDAVPDDAWQRTSERRDGEVFTVAGLARFTLHEAHHHLGDARPAVT